MLKWKDPYFGAGLVKEDEIKSSAADLNRMIRADTSAVSNESSSDPTDLKILCIYRYLLLYLWNTEFKKNILHRAFASQHFPRAPILWRQALTRLHGFKHCKLWYYFNFWEFGIWNLDHLVTCGIPYANTYGIPANFTAKNTAKFCGIPRNSVYFSKNSVFRRKSKTHFRGHPSCCVCHAWALYAELLR